MKMLSDIQLELQSRAKSRTLQKGSVHLVVFPSRSVVAAILCVVVVVRVALEGNAVRPEVEVGDGGVDAPGLAVGWV